MSKSFISTDQELHKGDCLVSNNGNYKAVLQEDGNFVLYKWTPVWATGTNDKDPFRVLLQTDTNLVMYNKQNKPVWCTGSYIKDGNCQRLRLTVTDEGKLVVFNDGKIIWDHERGRC